MSKGRRWSSREVICRETKRKTRLLVELKDDDGVEVVNGVMCDCPQLAAHGGEDCEWSCWEEITREE